MWYSCCYFCNAYNPGFENIMIKLFSKISKYRKYWKYEFSIFVGYFWYSISSKVYLCIISNKLLNHAYPDNSVFIYFTCKYHDIYRDIQGGPIKTAHFLRYHIFAASTDIITWFLLKCSEITEKTTSDIFKMSVKYSLRTSQNMGPCKYQC